MYRSVEANDLGFYDTQAIAVSVIPSGKRKYDLFAYKLYPYRFVDGRMVGFKIKSQAKEDLKAYSSIGYDIVSKSSSDFFECSPLSCNCACETRAVNRFCLMDDLGKAFQFGKDVSKRISRGEPGPYYVLEVYKKTLSR